MSIKALISSQYRNKVNQAAGWLRHVSMPPEGWICTVRNALGMSAAQLARRQNKTRALISRAEKAELHGRVTLKTMQALAEAMNCRFVYAIVPHDDVESILERRADEKARRLVEESSSHMALEQQALSNEQLVIEIQRLKKEMIENMPADFWDEEA